MKLVASMIVHNELARYFPLVIEQLVSFCDEVRVLDDGSDDGTYEWLAGIKDKVVVRRNPGPSFYEHEGRARENLLDWTFEAAPDFVLSIDADEFIGQPDLVWKAMEEGNLVYTLQMKEVWQCREVALEIRVDNLWAPRRCPILWRAPGSRMQPEWHIPDVKLACGREPLAVRRTRAQVSGADVLHFGWANRNDRQQRAERYFVHDGGKFHQDRHLQSILWPDERVMTLPGSWPEALTGLRDRIVTLANVEKT